MTPKFRKFGGPNLIQNPYNMTPGKDLKESGRGESLIRSVRNFCPRGIAEILDVVKVFKGFRVFRVCTKIGV